MRRTTVDLSVLEDIFARNRAEFGGWVMKADDDEEEVDDPGADDDGDDDDDDEDDPDEGKTDEELRAELKETRAALTKANAEAKKRRLRARDAAKAKPGKHKAAGTDDDGDDGDEAEKRVGETEAKWKSRLVKAEAKGALASAGASKPERLLGLLDIDALEVDDDGTVDGLDDELDRLKEEFPELFRRTRTRSATVETGDRSTRGGTSKPKTATERQAAAILGRK